MKPLLVGELNPYGPATEYALYPDPPGCSGWRLCHIVLGMTETVYFAAFDRINLCSRKWSTPYARDEARQLRESGRRVIVMLGRKVAAAFGHVTQPPFTSIEVFGVTYLAIPHPSGLCRVWQEPGAIERARDLILRHL